MRLPKALRAQFPVALPSKGAGIVPSFEWPLWPSFTVTTALPHGPDAVPLSSVAAPQLAFTWRAARFSTTSRDARSYEGPPTDVGTWGEVSVVACVNEEPLFEELGELERGDVSELEPDELLSDSSLGAGFGGGGAEAVQSDDISSLALFSSEGSTAGFFAGKHAARASPERRANPRIRLGYHHSTEPAI